MKKAIKFLIPLLMTLLILASVIWYLFVYDRTFTRDALLGQARFQDLHGNARLSSLFYDAAYSFSGHDDNVAIELANQYKGDGNFTKAEYTLTHAIRNNPTAEGYAALCGTFAQQNKLLDAVNLLANISDPLIKEQLDAMRPKAPTADKAEGFHSTYLDIRLHSSCDTIYYTTDGSFPSTSGPVFEDTISLPAGKTTIHAIAVDDNGLVSPMTTLTYTITGVIEEVIFTDPALESTIRTRINADSDDFVLSNALWDIQEFTVPAEAFSYQDLTLMPNLKKLTFEPQAVESLSFAASLTNLEELDLTGCKFAPEELAHLTGLVSLKTLILSDCNLSTIAGLENAVALYTLDLSNNTLRNLDVLSTMVTLKELNLQHNAVTSLSALGSLSELEKLDISFNNVSDLSPLSKCLKLTSLLAGNNQLKKLASVSSLKNLTELDVEYNQLTSVEALPGLTELKNLSIAGNEIKDITSLKTLTKLEVFDFSSNQIAILPNWPDGCALITIDGSYNQLTSLDRLKNMDALTNVFMDYNVLTNIDALADCFCLVQVNVFGNSIKDVEKLRDKDIIVNYDPTYGMKDK